MIIRFGIYPVLAASAAAFALHFALPSALLAWTVLVASLCIGSAVLIARQPMDVSTAMGRVGGSLVRWGFRAGRGQFIPAVAISWLIWTVLGSLLMGLTVVRADPKSMLMLLAWTIDVMALFYVSGLVLVNRGSGGRVPGSLLVVVAALVVVIGVSVFSWHLADTDTAEMTALALAGGPLALVGIGYGIMLALMVGRGHRAN
jgi:hypothetical protein